MAADFAVPLITNVKIAKLLVEAIVRKYPLEVSTSTVDYKTSHASHIPTFIEDESRTFYQELS